jgi:hypothetical protein
MVPSFSIQQVAEACNAAMKNLIEDLPAEIGGRLKLPQVVQRHGTDTRVFIYHTWDRHQPSLLDYRHFSYGVIYDPALRYHRQPLLVRFYANRKKLYDKRDAVIPALWEEMLIAEKTIYNFSADQNQQMIGLFRYFQADSIDELKRQVYQGFLELMPYWHSRYSAVIDQYGAALTDADVKEVIAGRQKFQHPGPRSLVARVEYSRHVPSRLRAEVFTRDGGRCLKCGNEVDLHADHIVPVSLGGLTVLENLQTLCARENLGKGNRESIDYRKYK